MGRTPILDSTPDNVFHEARRQSQHRAFHTKRRSMSPCASMPCKVERRHWEPSAPPEPAPCRKPRLPHCINVATCHSLQHKMKADVPSGMTATQSEVASPRTKHATRASPSATPVTQNDGRWMCPRATPATQSECGCHQVPRLLRQQPGRPRHQTGTKSTAMPRKVDATSAFACLAKPRRPQRQTGTKRATRTRPRAVSATMLWVPPAIQSRVQCHQAPRLPWPRKWRSPSATPQTAWLTTASNRNQVCCSMGATSATQNARRCCQESKLHVWTRCVWTGYCV